MGDIASCLARARVRPTIRGSLPRRFKGLMMSPAGSSSGSGTAANLWAANIGTERTRVTPPGDKEERGGLNPAQAKAMAEAIDVLDISDEVDLDKDRPRYEADQQKDLELTTTHGIDAVMKQHQLDAILFPGSSGSGLGARPGYPTVIVPFALVPNEPTPPFPAGFNHTAALRCQLRGDGVQ